MSLTPAPSLTVQGQFSWDNLGHQTLSLSVDALRRLALAGVSSYTVTIGQHACSLFRLGSQGRQNIVNALASLKSYSSWGNVLHFGFDIQSLPRLLGTTDQGMCLLALASALEEGYNEDNAGRVLFEMVAALNTPEQLMPSLNEWCRLADVCAGILSTTKFALLLDQFTTLCEGVLNQSDPLTAASRPRKSSDADPQRVAQSLLAIGKVSQGELSGLYIKGGKGIAWIAASTIWLFDLRILVERESDSMPVYSNCAQGIHPQIRFVLSDASNDTKCSANDFEVVAQTFHIIQIDDIISNSRLIHATGRLAWQTCLQSVFGDRFLLLLQDVRLLGSLFGYAETILRTSHDANLMENAFQSSYYEYLDLYRFFAREILFDSVDFMSNTLHWFPELDVPQLRSIAYHRSMQTNVSEAYETAMGRLATVCACGACDVEPHIYRSAHCLVVIFETIVKLSCLLAQANEIAPDLCPTRRGFTEIIKLQAQQKGSHIKRILIGAMPKLSAHILDDALILFHGPISYNRVHGFARCEGGICAYFDSLRELSLSSESLYRYNIVPGKATKAGHVYNSVLPDRRSTETKSHTVERIFHTLGSYEFLKLHCVQDRHCLQLHHVLENQSPFDDPQAHIFNHAIVHRRIVEAMDRLDSKATSDCECDRRSMEWSELKNGDWDAKINGRRFIICSTEKYNRFYDYCYLLSLNNIECFVQRGNCICNSVRAAKYSIDDKVVFILKY